MAAALSFIPAALTVASMVTGAQGASAAAKGAKAAARANATAAKFQADQLRVNAGQQIAAGQAAAFEQERQARLVASGQLARAAASGAGASDPTINTLISRTAKEGSYRAAVALYQGEDAARQMRMAAAGKEYEAAAGISAGESQAQVYKLAGQTAILKGGSSLFAKYGAGGIGKTGSGDTAVFGLDTSWLDAGSVAMPGVT